MIPRYRLAPMDTLLSVLTTFCYAIPIVFVIVGSRIPPPTSYVLLGTAAFVVALYGFVWVWLRPTAFVITSAALEIEWPLRRRAIPHDNIVAARILDRRGIRRELGRVMRIGAGGLWGGFGRATTAKGMHELWVSRVDRWVWITCEGSRSLLITPADPERFVAELAAGQRSGSSTRSNSK